MTAEDRPHLDQINLVVHDMDAMVDFYGRLGLEVASFGPQWDQHHREVNRERGMHFDLDSEASLAQWNRGWPAGRTGPVIGFRVTARETVDAIHADLVAAGYASQQQPFDAFWGARYAVVTDPEGNPVGIMSESDPAMRSRPGEPPSGA